MLDPFGRRSFLNCLNCSTKVALNVLHFVFVKVGEVYVGSRFCEFLCRFRSMRAGSKVSDS